MLAQIFTTHINFRKRFFAWWLVRFGGVVDDLLAERKRKVFADASGKVLEIGAGTGLNVRYIKEYSDLILLEPNPLFHRYLTIFTPNVHINSAEQIELPDASVDTVISSMVLCSVRDIDKAISEVARVLKPGGTYRFIEHIGAPHGTWLRNFQHFLGPVCHCLGDGCHPDRDIEINLRNSGFEIVQIDQFEANVNDPLIRHFVSGVLRKNNR